MAIQNFLSGGFYGSIGKLTGRRWKNKRVLQAKFSPKNPKTPAQELQRRLFTRGSALAKIGQQVNWNAIQFKNPIRTDWNQRQSVAIDALKNGAEEWEALPLAPTDFKAQHTIGVVTLGEITEDKQIKLVLQGTNLIADKKYSCAIFVNSGEKKGAIYVGTGATETGSAENITLRFDDVEGIKGEECYVKIASIDDTEIDTVTLSAGVLLQQQMEIPYKFEPSLVSVEDYNLEGLLIKVKLGQEALESYDPFTNISLRIYGKAWAKLTAVTEDILDEENGQSLDVEFTSSRTTVAKSTATVSFLISEFNTAAIEKYDVKIDISFNANNIKGENTAETSQLVQLTAQEFPEYLQDELPQQAGITLMAKTNRIATYYGDQMLEGKMYLASDTSEKGEVLYTNAQEADIETDSDDFTSITLEDGGTYTGNDISELFDNGDITNIDEGHFAWGIPDRKLKSFVGNITFGIVGQDSKIAFNGYRVFKCTEDNYYYDFYVSCEYN